MALNLKYEPNVLVEDITQLTEDDWLTWRTKGIGGSDVAAVLGISPWQTRRDLFYEKTGVKPVIEDEANWVAKEVGRRLEDLVAEIYRRKTGYKVYPIRRMFQHPLYPFMLADVDFFVEKPDGTRGILECKTSNIYSKDNWADDAVPVFYECQGRHYLNVVNLDFAAFACLFGNSETEFTMREIARDLDYEESIIREEESFWHNEVQAGVEPPYTESGDLVLASIRRYKGLADAKLPQINLPPSCIPILEEYIRVRDEKAAAEKHSRELEKLLKGIYAPIIDKMGAGCTAVCSDGQTTYQVSYKPSQRETVDKDTLRVTHPDIYSQIVKVTETRSFKVMKEDVA